MKRSGKILMADSSLSIAESPLRTPEYSCTVIVPVRNEAGNLTTLLDRIPVFGHSLEVVLVEGGSSDETWELALRESKKKRRFSVRAMQQSGVGKRNALIESIAVCQGELVLILDGDLSVDPEALIEFYRIIQMGRSRFLMGTRFRCPMEAAAMPFLNNLANQFFAMCWRRLLKRPVSDVLCGTKVFFRRDFMPGNYDLKMVDEPFGDFSLLLGMAILDLPGEEVPVWYRARRYGKTNISRWRDGAILLLFVLKSAKILRRLSRARRA